MTSDSQSLSRISIAGWDMPTSLHRWLVFNSVGALGFVVQLTTLALLMGWLEWNYVPATALAVETAVVHNFFWHEHWTWADRAEAGRWGSMRRFLRFNLTNGALSIAGNLIFMRLFLGTLPVNYAAANTLAIAVCSILNFVVSDLLVFRKASTSADTRTSRARHRSKEEP